MTIKKKKTKKKSPPNKDGRNQRNRTMVAEFYDKKGHTLQSVWFRKNGASNSLKMVNDVKYCPKCELFFKITFDKLKVVI